MPVKMADLTFQLPVPIDIVGRGYLFGEGVGVVGDAKETETGENRIELSVLPVAGELLELGEIIVKIVILRVQLLDIAGGVELLDIFGIRQDDVEGTGRDWAIRPSMLSPPV